MRLAQLPLEQLVVRARAGDRRAANALTGRMRPQARRLAVAVAGDPRVAPRIARRALSDAVADVSRPYPSALVAATQRLSLELRADHTGPVASDGERLERAVLLLCDAEGHSHRSAAELLGLPAAEVARVHARGRAALGLAPARESCRGWYLVSRAESLTAPEREAADNHVRLCRACTEELAARAAARARLKVLVPAGGVTVGSAVAVAGVLLRAPVAALSAAGGPAAAVVAGAAAATAIAGAAAVPAMSSAADERVEPGYLSAAADEPGRTAAPGDDAGDRRDDGLLGSRPLPLPTSISVGNPLPIPDDDDGTLTVPVPTSVAGVPVPSGVLPTAVPVPVPTAVAGVPVAPVTEAVEDVVDDVVDTVENPRLPEPVPTASVVPVPTNAPHSSDPLPLPLPSAVPVPTVSPLPLPLPEEIPLPTVTTSPLPVPVPTVSPLPIVSQVPLPTVTAVPVPGVSVTPLPLPTVSTGPLPLPTVSSTPLPTPTAVPVPIVSLEPTPTVTTTSIPVPVVSLAPVPSLTPLPLFP